MIGLVVTGHGNFGSGLTSSVNLIAGEPANYEYVDFTVEKTPEILEDELREAFDRLKECEGIIVLSDLPGGSPFKVAATLAQGYKDVYVLGGTNLPMIAELTMARTMIEDVNALVDMAINTGKDQIVKFEIKKPAAQVEPTDGI